MVDPFNQAIVLAFIEGARTNLENSYSALSAIDWGIWEGSTSVHAGEKMSQILTMFSEPETCLQSSFATIESATESQ